MNNNNNNITFIYLLFLFIFLCGGDGVLAHTCIHDSVELHGKRDIMSTPQTYTDSYPYPNNTKPIRLLIDTSYLDNDVLGMTCYSTGQVVQVQGTSTTTSPYTCSSADVLTSTLRGYLYDLLDKAQQLFEGTLNVMPVQGNFMLVGSAQPQGLYGGVYLSSDYTNGIPDVDMVIFVTARPILQDGGATTTLAVARVVQEDQYGRPVFGHLNLNMAGIDTTAATYPRNFGVVIHEMTHSLGYNIQKFKSINALPGYPSDITKTLNLNVGANDMSTTRTIISSPRVVAWARNYFGCDTVQGVELEDQGGQGTELSHWEKRVVMNEYMTGTASRNPVFSELTLSLLEDSGWYVVNYSLAGQLLWGQGLGCDFTNRGCNNWPAHTGYFCSSNNQKGCTADYQAKGVCQISSASNVPAEYQYFSDPTKVGSYDLPDYCPVTWGYDNGWCFDTSAGSSSIVDRGEVFGSNSRCFTSTLVKDLALGATSDSVCYETYCTGPAELRVKIGSYWYLCPAGSSIKVIGFGGVLTCPDRIEQICAYSATDDTWPIFLTISPNAGGPGLNVSIVGSNFVEGTTVRIGDPLINVVVVSSTLITATIPNSNTYKNPTNIIDQAESVVITDPKGRSAVGYDKFTIKVKLDKTFLKNALEYLKDNWLVTTAIVASLVVTILVCGYCCYRQKGTAEEADTDYYA